MRDSDITIDGAAHRPALRASVGARGGAVTRALDAGGWHVLTEVATRIAGTTVVHVARLSGCVGLPGRVSGAALVAESGRGTDADGPACGATEALVHSGGVTSAVRLLGGAGHCPPS